MTRKIQGVLVTRPTKQSDIFCGHLTQLGIHFEKYPMVVIHAMPVETLMARILCQQADIVIATSQNAITHCPDIVWTTLSEDKDCAFFAVGSMTAQALQAKGVTYITTPEHPNTEALLDLLPVSLVKNKKIVILAGQLSRPLLQTQLVARGAQVDVLETYRRSPPLMVPQSTWQYWETCVDTVVLTSQAAATNLLNSLPLAHSWLSRCVFVVASKRIACCLHAKLYGGQITIAESAYDEDMVAAVLNS